MPQLRDSGNHGSWQEARRSSQFQGFARIFGVETEYGVSVTGSDRPVDAAQVAMMMFQPVVSRARSTNTYLTNGSRLYLDVGSHPEYATAEARDPMDALLQDLAGERVMAGLALDAQALLRARYGDGVNVHVFKNNADSAGHSF
ncbi:proteasome accessory factor PafA2 family protein, partial [Bifidobacterium bifidum]